MTQENKELLLKDICARLPYGVKVQFKLPDHINKVFTEEIGEIQSISKYGEVSINSKGIDYRLIQLDCKPYLRPMSSITNAEKSELELMGFRYLDGYIINEDVNEYDDYGTHPYTWVDETRCSEVMDFLNSHHFDHRGLIEKGLALEAREGMYD